MKNTLIGLITGLGMLLSLPASADINSVSYVGELLDSSGAPISGSATITVEVFDAAVDGSSLQSQTFDNVAVVSGVFTVVLQDTAFVNGGDAFLEFTVDGQLLSPRLAHGSSM